MDEDRPLPETNGNEQGIDLERRLKFLDMIGRLSGAALMATNSAESEAIYTGQIKTLAELGSKPVQRARIIALVQTIVRDVKHIADNPNV
jgi:hypothetical protein